MSKKYVTYRVTKEGNLITLVMTYGDAVLGIEFTDTEEFEMLYKNFDDIVEHALDTLAEEEIVYDSTRNLDDQLNAMLTVENLDTDKPD